MNHQGDQTGQFNHNAIQNDVNPYLPIGALQRLNPSSSSLTARSDQRFPNRLYGQNIILLYQENANIFPNNGSDLSDEAAQIESFQSNIHLQTTPTTPHAFIRANRLSNDYTRGLQVPLPSQAPLFYQSGHPPFFSSSETVVGATFSMQPFEYAPNFREDLWASTWINNMSSRNVPLIVLPVYSEIRSEAMTYFHNPRIIQGNIMLGTQIERGNRANNPTNFRFVNGTANFLGNLPNHFEQYGYFPGTVYLSNAPTWVPQSNLYEHHMQISSRIANNPGAQAIAFPRQSIHGPLDLDLSESSQEMDLSIVVGNSITENEHSSMSRSEIHVGGNFEPHFTSLSLSSFEMRSRLTAQVRAGLEYLRAGDTLQIEEPMILDYSSLVLHLLEVRNNRQNEGNVLQGGLILVEEQNDYVDMGLTEEEIMKYIRNENFESTGEETPENKEACSICQEDYVNGEEVGRLDCVHRFHVNCIKQWLMLKNICPNCKRTALLPTVEDDDD